MYVYYIIIIILKGQENADKTCTLTSVMIIHSHPTDIRPSCCPSL